MIIIRIFLCILITLFSLYLSSDYMVFFSSTQKDIFVIDGILNVWGSISGVLIGSFFLLYYICQVLNYIITPNKLNKIALILIFIISPLMSLVIRQASNAKITNYEECKNLREISTRYSSKTYAKSMELCQ